MNAIEKIMHVKLLRTVLSGVILAACGSHGLVLAQATDAPPEIDYTRLIFDATLLPPAAVPPKATGAEGAGTSGPASSGGGTVPSATEAPTSGESDNGFIADIERYRNGLAEALESGGPYSSQLREQYLSLALVQQRAGLHAEAIASFESAMHIDRVNGGLYTTQQIPLVENIIASYSALNNVDEVSNYEEYLYYINQKSFADDDPQLLAAKERWADWNVRAYLKQGNTNNAFSNPLVLGNSSRPDFVAVQNPRNGSYIYVPRNQMNNVLNPNGIATNATITDFYMRSSAFSVSPEMMMDERLRRARDLYQEIIDHPSTEFQQTRDRDVELKLASIAYATKQEFDALENQLDQSSLGFNRVAVSPNMPNPVVTQGYTRNRESLEALVARAEQDPAKTPVSVAKAYIDVGDWHMAYDRNQRAREAYQSAIDVMKAGGLDAPAMAAIFNPKPLVPLPGFALHPHTRAFFGYAADAPLDYAGYFDVQLTINENGGVRDLRIMDAQPEAPQRLRSLLLDYLREHAMRPQLVDGTLAKEAPMTVRVHYHY